MARTFPWRMPIGREKVAHCHEHVSIGLEFAVIVLVVVVDGDGGISGTGTVAQRVSDADEPVLPVDQHGMKQRLLEKLVSRR